MAYGERVKNRTELAGKLKGTARAKSAGIKDADRITGDGNMPAAFEDE